MVLMHNTSLRIQRIIKLSFKLNIRVSGWVNRFTKAVLTVLYESLQLQAGDRLNA